MRTAYPADVEAAIQRMIESGRFSDPDAVVREAVQLLEEIERRRDVLRAKIQSGIDQADRGELIDWTPELREQIRQSARRRARLGERPHPDVCP